MSDDEPPPLEDMTEYLNSIRPPPTRQIELPPQPEAPPKITPK